MISKTISQFLITIRNNINFFKKISIYKNFYYLIRGSIIAQLILFIVTPVITRLYTPSDYGIFSLYLVMVSIMVIFATLKYEIAIPLPDNDESAINLVFLSIILILIIGFFEGIILYFITGSNFFGSDLSSLTPYILLAVASAIGGGLYNVFNYWGIREKGYQIIANTSIGKSIAGSGGKIAFGALGFAPLGLLLGNVLEQFTGTISLARLFLRKLRNYTGQISFDTIAGAAKKFYKFPVYSCPSTLLNVLAFQMPIIMLVSYFGTDIAGLYSLANAILILPASLVSMAIAQAYLGEISPLIQSEPARIKAIYHSLAKKLAIFAIPTITIIAMAAPLFFPYLFGTVWKEAGVYCIALTFTIITQVIFSPISILHYSGYNSWVMIFDLARTTLIIAVFMTAAYLGLSAFLSLLIYSLTMALMYGINYLMNIRVMDYLVRDYQH